MLSTLTPTQVAFLLIAVLQTVAAGVWALAGWFARAERAALLHWSAYAALSAITWTMLSLHLQSPPLLVVLIGMCSALTLCRGIRLFIDRPWPWSLALLSLALVVVAGSLGDEPAWRSLQATVNFGVLAALFLVMALDLRRYARDELQWRVPLALTLPVLLGAVGFGSRALRALLWPESVPNEMTVHSALNVGSALAYIVLVLLMHATLMALVVTRLLGRLQQLARRDALTGLLNRRAMHAALDQHARQHRRAGDTFSVLMIDVDHFKDVNDRHGHDAGDRALMHISRLMAQALRAQDRLARFGGEEFVALLPASNLARALAVAESLRLQVRGQPLHLDGRAVPLSVSIGVAEWAGSSEDLSRLLARADDALYRAKRLGRDRVEAATQGGAEPLPQLG